MSGWLRGGRDGAGDRLGRHASVDRLGGQGVPELVGVNVREPGCGAGLVDEPGDGVSGSVPVGTAA